MAASQANLTGPLSLRTRLEATVAEADAKITLMIAEIPTVVDNDSLRAQRRADIIAVSYEEFAHGGFYATSMNQIARRVGVDKRTLYDYVGNKEDILYLLFLHFLPLELHRLHESLTADDSPERQLRNLVNEHLQFIADYPMLPLLAYREMRYLERSRISNLLWIIEHTMRIYDGVVEWGVEKGVMQCRSPRVAAHAIRAALDMPGLSAWDLQRFPHAEIESTILELILDGLLRDPRAS